MYLEDVVCYIVFDSSQIKRVTNINPTKSRNIDEAYEFPNPDKGFFDIKDNSAT